VSLVPVPAVAAPSPSELDRWRAGFDSDDSQASLDRIGTLAEEAEAREHARRTQDSYDYWWGKFVEWLTDPATRRVGRPWPATTLPIFGSVVGTQTGDDLIFAWLSERVYGPEDPAEHEEWLQDFGSCSPNTLAAVVSALKSRISRLTEQDWSPGTKLEKRLRGMSRHCREQYGSDVKAYPLITAQISVMAAHLATSQDVQVLRDRLVLELTVAGVGAAEIARCRADAVRDPEMGVLAVSNDANQALYDATGHVGMRTLVVPGRPRRNGNADPSRLIPLTPHHPLTVALDQYLAAVGPASEDDPWLIRGVTADNRRACVREMLLGLGAHAGWRPTATAPAPAGGTLEQIRQGLRAVADGDELRRHRDLAMLWVGYVAALRRSELLGLTVGALEPIRDAHRYVLRLGVTKTDQKGKGTTLPVPGTTSEAGTHLDPVAAVDAWLQDLRRIYGVRRLPKSTPLWPALDRAGRILVHQGRRITRMSDQAWSERLKVIAGRSGAVTDPDDLALVSGHSLRRGFVTQAALLGKNALQISKRTRHVNLTELSGYVDEIQHAYGDAGISTDDLVTAALAA